MDILRISLIAVNLMATNVGYAQSPLFNEVVAMWQFDEVGRPRSIEDTSGNGHDALVVHKPKFADGKFGTAIRSNRGTENYLEVPDHEALQLTDAISMVAWVKRPPVAKDRAPYYILAKGNTWQSNISGYGIALHKVFNNMFYFWYKGGFQGTDGIKDDQWHHYAVVAKNGARRPTLYIDGKLKSVTHEDGETRIELVPTPPHRTINLIIGALVPGKARFDSFSDNTIDEVAVFKTALMQSDIQTLMTNGLDRGIYSVSPSGKLATR